MGTNHVETYSQSVLDQLGRVLASECVVTYTNRMKRLELFVWFPDEETGELVRVHRGTFRKRTHTQHADGSWRRYAYQTTEEWSVNCISDAGYDLAAPHAISKLVDRTSLCGLILVKDAQPQVGEHTNGDLDIEILAHLYTYAPEKGTGRIGRVDLSVVGKLSGASMFGRTAHRRISTSVHAHDVVTNLEFEHYYNHDWNGYDATSVVPVVGHGAYTEIENALERAFSESHILHMVQRVAPALEKAVQNVRVLTLREFSAGLVKATKGQFGGTHIVKWFTDSPDPSSDIREAVASYIKMMATELAPHTYQNRFNNWCAATIPALSFLRDNGLISQHFAVELEDGVHSILFWYTDQYSYKSSENARWGVRIYNEDGVVFESRPRDIVS